MLTWNEFLLGADLNDDFRGRVPDPGGGEPGKAFTHFWPRP